MQALLVQKNRSARQLHNPVQRQHQRRLPRTRSAYGTLVLTANPSQQFIPSNDTNLLATVDGDRNSVENVWQPWAVAHLHVPELDSSVVWPLRGRLVLRYFMWCLLRNNLVPRILHHCENLHHSLLPTASLGAYLFRLNSCCSLNNVNNNPARSRRTHFDVRRLPRHQPHHLRKGYYE